MHNPVENHIQIILNTFVAEELCTLGQVNCETVNKWILKNSAESENLNWILAHTKQCPKCKRPIEKNQGCMHMTCRCAQHP